jgi:hypothetical protein
MNTKRVLTDLRARHEQLTKGSPIGLIGAFDTKSSVDRANRLIRATATTRGVDLSNEVVVPGGADWSYLDANKKVFVDHITDFEHTVGVIRNRTARTVLTQDSSEIEAWTVTIHVLESKKAPYGDDILALAEEAGIGLSIGFIPLDVGPPTAAEIKRYGGGKRFASIIRRFKLFEISFTCLPCNVECQTGGVSASDDKALGVLDNLVTKGRISRETARLFGLESKALVGADGKPLARTKTILTIEEGTAAKSAEYKRVVLTAE